MLKLKTNFKRTAQHQELKVFLQKKILMTLTKVFIVLKKEWEVQWAQMDRAEEVDTLAADGSSAHLE